ncbi:MAG TPA: FAD-dependent oxidoreductase, partial [Saprospiraceae bacterium]|nr:FAD-dependent oxidoreductase [Saprospiraceae bacterium]
MRILPQFSYWERETFLNDIDVAIIGGGIVGLNAAITIKDKEPDWKVCIIERGALPAGASTKNAGFACFGSVSEILEDIQTMGEEACFNLIKRRCDGLKRLRERVGDSNMDFKSLGGYEVFKEDDKLMYQQCIDAVPRLNERLLTLLGLENTYQSVDHKLSDFGFSGFNHMIWNQWEGQINPGKMMKTLMDIAQQLGVIFLNGLTIKNIFDSGESMVSLQTEEAGYISVKKVLVATNGFARRLLPLLDVRPARNQVVVTHPVKGISFEACFHYDRGYYYWRNIDGRILLGGGRNQFPNTENT